MEEDSREKEALSKLLVDNTTYVERLAHMTQGLIGIDKSDGHTVYLSDTSRLTDEEKVFLVLLGRYFSHKLGKSDSDSSTPTEITEESGLTEKTVSKRLSDLEDNRFAENTMRGRHRVVPANAEKMLTQINQPINIHKRKIKSPEKTLVGRPKTAITKGSIFDRLIALRDEKYFDTPRTLGEIVQKFAEQSYHYPPQSLTEPLQRAVRNHELGRVKKDKLWAYCKR